MKTAERENPNRRPQCVANRADGAASQYRSCSIMWAAKQENFQPAEKCFFLTSPFIELTGRVPYQDFTRPISAGNSEGADNCRAHSRFSTGITSRSATNHADVV